jgi:hypothetical protein
MCWGIRTLPLLSVFPQKNLKLEFLDGALSGTIAAFHPAGWIQ